MAERRPLVLDGGNGVAELADGDTMPGGGPIGFTYRPEVTTATYTFVLADANCMVPVSTYNCTLTIPADVFAVGTVIYVSRTAMYAGGDTIVTAGAGNNIRYDDPVVSNPDDWIVLIHVKNNFWISRVVPVQALIQPGAGNNSIMIGSGSDADGASAVAIRGKASGNNSLAVGRSSYASASYTACFGYYAYATQSYATAVGYSTAANYIRSTAIGYDAATTKADQVMLGAAGSVTTFAGLAELAVYTVAGLPATAVSGSICYASDARKPGEAASAGTGMPVFYDAVAAAWYTFDGVTVTS